MLCLSARFLHVHLFNQCCFLQPWLSHCSLHYHCPQGQKTTTHHLQLHSHHICCCYQGSRRTVSQVPVKVLLLLLTAEMLLLLLRCVQVVSQLNTFLVAAFETTASAIVCCIYFIAQHPQVQDALLAEVDAFGRQRRVAFSDLDQVRHVF